MKVKSSFGGWATTNPLLAYIPQSVLITLSRRSRTHDLRAADGNAHHRNCFTEENKEVIAIAQRAPNMVLAESFIK